MAKIKKPKLSGKQHPHIISGQYQKETYEAIEKAYDHLNDISDTFHKRIDNFYGKIIEIFGIFIAIFALVILGTGTALTCTGGFQERLLCATAVFIPITVALIILVVLVHCLKR